jgi:hypothetical protein
MEASGAERADQAERRPFLDFSQLQKAEFLGFGAAVVLLVSLFLPWFSTSGNGSIEGTSYPASDPATAFDVYNSLDWLLVAACSAPFILAYIIARGHALSWRPGEVTAIVGLTAFVLILCNGIVFGKPGEPPGVTSFEVGYVVGLVGAAGIAASGFVRQLEGTRRKPPGV